LLNQNKDKLAKAIDVPKNIKPFYDTGLSSDLQYIVDSIELQILIVEGFCRHENGRNCRGFLFSSYSLIIVTTVIEFVKQRRPS